LTKNDFGGIPVPFGTENHQISLILPGFLGLSGIVSTAESGIRKIPVDFYPIFNINCRGIAGFLSL